MSKTYNIAIIIGSLRKESYNRKLGKAFQKLAPVGLKLEFVEIGDLPMYNEDLETDNPPAAWTKFREELKKSDGFIFITPEYNRSLPGALKNAIDVGSRPYGKSAWDSKPGAVISTSPGALGAFGANHQLRQALVFNNVYTMQQPEAYIGHIQNLVTDNGEAATDNARAFFTSIITAFEDWIKKLA